MSMSKILLIGSFNLELSLTYYIVCCHNDTFPKDFWAEDFASSLYSAETAYSHTYLKWEVSWGSIIYGKSSLIVWSEKSPYWNHIGSIVGVGDSSKTNIIYVTVIYATQLSVALSTLDWTIEPTLFLSTVLSVSSLSKHKQWLTWNMPRNYTTNIHFCGGKNQKQIKFIILLLSFRLPSGTF